MDQWTLKPRKAMQEAPVEAWDDDEDLDIGGDDFTFRSASLATTAASQHRESVSSRLSIRSDFDSNNGDDEKQLLLPDDDESATSAAIATATKAGIPIPHNVPSSALMGGTIKRLGGRKIKKLMQDDWDDGDLEVPIEGGLQIKRPDGSMFPEALRQVSGPTSMHSSPARQHDALRLDMGSRPDLQTIATSLGGPMNRGRSTDRKVARPNRNVTSNPMLDRFRDDEELDDFMDDGSATIKVAKVRNTPSKPSPFVPVPAPQKSTDNMDDFEQDLQLPSDGHLKLSTRRDVPKTPITTQDDFEDWGEGSLGTRFGGTRRDARSSRSNRSSSTAISPSATSSFTAESEDDGLDGLIIPTGPIAFGDILRKRQTQRSPEPDFSEDAFEKPAESKEDFLDGIDIGPSDVFVSKKHTFNRNVKVTTVRATSPTRPKSTVTLSFTNKPTNTPVSRLPRPLGHERVPSALEPVSESGGPIPARRSQTRMGHSAQSSVHSVSTPSTPHFGHTGAPATPRRRELHSKASNGSLRDGPTTTNSQILKLKRSMPSIPDMRSGLQSPARPTGSRYERPPSRTELGVRPLSRPKTPAERGSGSQSSLANTRKHPVPFIPNGPVQGQSHHIANKHIRRRNDSDTSSNYSSDVRPASRAVSRSFMRSPSPRRSNRVGTIAPKLVTKSVRRRLYGDGGELDGFDDLPTSRDSEKPFEKAPLNQGTLKTRRPPSRTMTPTPVSPTKNLPRFAQDTTASRKAREHVLSQRAPSASGAPLTTLTNQWKAKVTAVTGLTSINAQGSVRNKKPKSPQKPFLIKSIANSQDKKTVSGMTYNPITCCWEGNDNDLASFDASPPRSVLPHHILRQNAGSPLGRLRDNAGSPLGRNREKENSTPRPALITNIGSTQNVQRTGNMVFDPKEMRWHEVDAAHTDDDDVFKDVPDLQDSPSKDDDGNTKTDNTHAEWLVGEEFDVGPEFVRRQREEEERWRKKCTAWIDAARDQDDFWRWTIRDVVADVVDES